MADGALRVRVFNVDHFSGDLVDKFNKDIEIICEYDPQGVNLKPKSGKCCQTIEFYWKFAIVSTVKHAVFVLDVNDCDLFCVWKVAAAGFLLVFLFSQITYFFYQIYDIGKRVDKISTLK